MFAVIFLLAFVKLVQSDALDDYPEDRVFCYNALVLAKPCQSQERFLYDEGTVHRVANSLRIRGRQLDGPGFQRILKISEEGYAKYLSVMRVLMLSRKSMGNVVENLREKNFRDYLPDETDVAMSLYKPVAGLLRSLNIAIGDTDNNVRLEYYRNARTALKTFASIHRDYNAYARLANMRKCWSLEQLKNFIGKSFVRFDFGATYPDAVMCLSLLQFFRVLGPAGG